MYADREHSATISYLTGFDPRFEEALLVVGQEGDPAILVGNECWGVAGVAPLPMRRHRFQDFSLPNQPRDRSRPLAEILGEEGIAAGSRIGVVGWKRYARPEMTDLPAYLVDELRGLVGASGSVENVTDLFIDPADGLRVVNEVEQLAAFEWASCQTSQGVRSLLDGLRVGMTEREAVALLGWNGWPLSCHLMLTAGPRARYGLLSPGDRPIERGDPFTTAFGIWGALTCRAGFVVEDADELPEPIRDYVERLVGPYFAAIAAWYGALRIGQSGGALQAIIDEHLGDPFFGIFLNPGHQIHLDEWVASPIYRGSTVELRSGMAFQVDVIPATGTEHFTTNIEDGIALADASLRAALAERFPDAWDRIQRRRDFMARTLGIELHPGRAPLLEPARRAASLPAEPAARDDPRLMAAAVRELELRSDRLEVVLLPELGARIHRIRAFGHDLLRTPPDPRDHAADPFFWGAYPMAPWCNRAPAGPHDDRRSAMRGCGRTSPTGRRSMASSTRRRGSSVPTGVLTVRCRRGRRAVAMALRGLAASDAWTTTSCRLRIASPTARTRRCRPDSASTRGSGARCSWPCRRGASTARTPDRRPEPEAADRTASTSRVRGRARPPAWTRPGRGSRRPRIELAWPRRRGCTAVLEISRRRRPAGRGRQPGGDRRDRGRAADPRPRPVPPAHRTDEPDAPALLEPGGELRLDLRLTVGRVRLDG